MSRVALAVPPDMPQVPETVIGAETVTVHDASIPLYPDPVAATENGPPVTGGVIVLGVIVSEAEGEPLTKTADACAPVLSVTVIT